MDTITEHYVQEAIASLGKSKTLVIIAHRLSTVQNADLIIVLDNGAVAESGTHFQLLEKGGKYSELAMKFAS